LRLFSRSQPGEYFDLRRMIFDVINYENHHNIQAEPDLYYFYIDQTT